MRKFKKIFLFFLIMPFLFGFFISPALADVKLNAGVPPEKNPICWTEEACQADLEFMKLEWSKDKFEKGGPVGICGSKLGVCIAAGPTKTEITIAGKTIFKNLGDYIKTIYIWVVGIGGLLASIMLIRGGFLYLTSAGSSQRVTDAKARIGGAILGLLLLLGSYTLLYTINPDLVQLRLPRAYLIRRILPDVKYCKELNQTKVAFAGGYTNSIEIPEVAFKLFSNPLIDDSSKIKGFIDAGLVPACSLKYFWVGSNDNTCWGHVCAPLDDGTPQVCMEETVNKKYTCIPGNLIGTITSSQKVFPYIDNNIKLIGICNDGKSFELREQDATNGSDGKSQSYNFSFPANFLKSEKNKCSNNGLLRGFYLGAEVNDEFGCDDWFAIGQNNGSCNVNLGKLLYPNAGKWNWGCGVIAKGQNSLVVPVENLISYKQLESGYLCDINIEGSEFPLLTNGSLSAGGCWIPDPTACGK